MRLEDAEIMGTSQRLIPAIHLCQREVVPANTLEPAGYILTPAGAAIYSIHRHDIALCIANVVGAGIGQKGHSPFEHPILHRVVAKEGLRQTSQYIYPQYEELASVT